MFALRGRRFRGVRDALNVADELDIRLDVFAAGIGVAIGVLFGGMRAFKPLLDAVGNAIGKGSGQRLHAATD